MCARNVISHCCLVITVSNTLAVSSYKKKNYLRLECARHFGRCTISRKASNWRICFEFIKRTRIRNCRWCIMSLLCFLEGKMKLMNLWWAIKKVDDEEKRERLEAVYWWCGVVPKRRDLTNDAIVNLTHSRFPIWNAFDLLLLNDSIILSIRFPFDASLSTSIDNWKIAAHINRTRCCVQFVNETSRKIRISVIKWPIKSPPKESTKKSLRGVKSTGTMIDGRLKKITLK